MNADGTRQRNLTRNPAEEDEPKWSPDGKKIAFRTGRDAGQGYEVYVMKANGSHQTNVSDNPAADVDAAWSLDGTRIAFASDRSGDLEIWAMDADASNPANLTNQLGTDRFPAYQPSSQHC